MTNMGFSFIVTVLALSTCCEGGGLVGWLLGRDSSPFDLDKDYEKLMAKSAEQPASQGDGGDGAHELALIPFELSLADAKFIADAQKYTDLNLSELDLCQHKLILQLKQDCDDLSEEELSKLGVNLLNCQSQLEGRRVYPCTSTMLLKECTEAMDADTWNAYHILSNRARSVCYGARQQQFRALTQMTVNKLMTTSSQQLNFIKELKAEQEELGSMAADTLDSLNKGQEKLLDQQNSLKATQQLASQQISITMREISRERAAAFASQKQLTALSESLKETLNQAAELAAEQENERRLAQKHLLESLANVEGHVSDFWSQLEDSVSKLMEQQEKSSSMQSETIETLHRLNHTFQFLLSVSENSRDQLHWIQGLVANTEKRLGKLSTWIVHVCYFLVGMLLLAFVQAPAYTRWIFLFLVPVNLAMDLQQGLAMELPALVGLLVLVSLGYRSIIFLKTRCRPVKERQRGIGYRSSTPDEKSKHYQPVADQTIEDLLGCTLVNDALDETRTGTPPPSQSPWSVSNAQPYPAHPVIRSILQDSRLEESVRRSPRRTSSVAGSFREPSPNRSVTPERSFANQSRSGTPRRPSTPRRTCEGKCVDGANCRNAATKDSTFCWQHK